MIEPMPEHNEVLLNFAEHGEDTKNHPIETPIVPQEYSGPSLTAGCVVPRLDQYYNRVRLPARRLIHFPAPHR